MSNVNLPQMEYTLGADYSWIGAVTEGVGNVIKGIMPKKEPPPPPPPKFPWIPVGIGAGVLVLGTMMLAKKPRRRSPAAA